MARVVLIVFCVLRELRGGRRPGAGCSIPQQEPEEEIQPRSMLDVDLEDSHQTGGKELRDGKSH